MAKATSASTFTLYAGDIPVICTRKRVRGIRLRLAADGTVHMSIPWHCPTAMAEVFLRSHTGWVREAASQGARRVEVDTGLGGLTRLWGELLPVDIIASPTARGVRASVVDGHVRVSVLQATATDPTALREALARSLDRLRKAEVERMLPSIISAVETEVGVHANSWTVRKMSSRWGSCTPSKRSIRLSSRLAELPPECLSMVATHECCHLIEPSHNARFRALMDAHCPGWRATRTLLDASAFI